MCRRFIVTALILLAGPIGGTTYLVVVDAFSKWPEIPPIMPPMTTETTQHLTGIFCQQRFN